MGDDGLFDEDPDLYEITDFTTSTEWERFIASVEAVIHEWKLTAVRTVEALKEGELSVQDWKTCSEDIKFASFAFKITRHYLEESPKSSEETLNLEDEPAPFALEDMMTLGNDFPPRAHYLVRWFGLRDFLVIAPSCEEEVISSEDRTKLLVSSVSVALNNSKCSLPAFVQVHHPQERLCFGVCVGGGLTTHFEMVHLNHVPKPCSNVSGLLSLFKGKLSYASQQSPTPIQLTIRFTYMLQDWSPASWPQLPPDVTNDWFDIGNLKLGKLPFGALEDPISEMQLSVTWPSIPEDVVVDNDVYSDLRPENAPKWSIRMRWKDNPECLMEEYLRNFFVVCQMTNSLDDVLKNMVQTEDLSAKAEILDALDRLAQPNALPFRLPQLPQPEVSSESPRNMLLRNQELLIEVLGYIFLSSDASPQEKNMPAECSEMESPSETHTSTKLLELKESLNSLKTTHPNSLLWRLALAAAHVYHACGGIEALAQLWVKVIAEMRYYWDNNLALPSLEPGTPNLAASILHQKLQMLNYCIERKKKRERRHLPADDSGSQRKSGSSESDEDVFYECPDDIVAEGDKGGSADNAANVGSGEFAAATTGEQEPVREGVLRRCGDMTLLGSDEPLYIPITQEPAPMTEDMLEQHAEALVKLGSNPEGAMLRARMQSACLFSDMEAFKAANPGASLSDFVRWYSPRDWVAPLVDQATGQVIEEGHLSHRMQLPGNTWQEVWETAQPMPAHRQKRLFDDTKEAEKVLYYLLSLHPREIVKLLMPILIHCALAHIIDHAHEGPRSLTTFLEQTVTKVASQLRGKEPKYKELLSLLYEAEVAVARCTSLRKKFYRENSTDSWATSPEDIGPHRQPSTTSSHLSSSKNQAETDVNKFVLDLVDNPEVSIPGAGKGSVGKLVSQLFVDSLKLQDSDAASEAEEDSECKFPSPVAREYILRTRHSRPTPASRPTPQRMFCVMAGNDFRLAGAFTHDTVFY
ncbi:RAB3 GTPase activating protein subunit 1 [Amblyomma americanum]